MAWLAAAALEIPQELGDFGVLVHGRWEKRKALMFNVLSALTFLVGGLLAYFLSFNIDVSFLIPFAAGNFLYIGASDLEPEVKEHENLRANSGSIKIVVIPAPGWIYYQLSKFLTNIGSDNW